MLTIFQQYGAKRVQRLPVSGAFHSPIMGPAQPALKDALDKVKIRLPQLPVYSNVTAQPYKNPEEIRRLALVVNISVFSNVELWIHDFCYGCIVLYMHYAIIFQFACDITTNFNSLSPKHAI